MNREILTKFLKETQTEDIDADKDCSVENMDAEKQDEVMEVDEEVKEFWADEILDEEIKALLMVNENGKNIPLDTVAHFEYFYNTLDCTYKTVNPFSMPFGFPALTYREETSNQSTSKLTVFEKHRQIIYPKSETRMTHSNTSNSSVSPRVAKLTFSNQQSSLDSFLLPKKYKWYPNKDILSPKYSKLSISPSPKVIQSYARRASAAVSNNPYKRVSGTYQ